MRVKKFLDDLSLQRAPGPYPSFTVFDLIKALELIAERGPMGRGRLSELLKIGGGAVRTLISRLRDTELIVTSQNGCSLTEKGKKNWNEIKEILPQKVKLEKNELTFAAFNVAVLIRDRGDRIKDGLKQRDAAVMVGAKGATTLVFKDNKLILPMISEDISKNFPVAFNDITRAMNLKENDVIIIGSADDLRGAEYSALAAAWSII